MAVLVAGSALAGAFAFYAMFGANFERPAPPPAPAAAESASTAPNAAADPPLPQTTRATVAPTTTPAETALGVAPSAADKASPPSIGERIASRVKTSSSASTTAVPVVESPALNSGSVAPPGTPLPAGTRERVNPGSRALSDAAIALLRSRQPDAARRLIDSALVMSPTDPEAYALRARANAARGDLRGAWADAEVTERLGDDWQAQTLIASFEARVGETRAARDRLATLVKRVPPKVPFTAKQGSQLALAYVAARDNKRALNTLLRTRDDGTLATTLKDPGFDAIRGEPRFRDILRAVAPDAQ
jgi:hypothetical protein